MSNPMDREVAVFSAARRLPAGERATLEKRLLGNESPAVAASLNRLARFLYDQGKFADAETGYREALMITRKLRGNEHIEVADALDWLVIVLAPQHQAAEAESPPTRGAKNPQETARP